MTPGAYRPVQLQSSAASGVTNTTTFEIWQTLPAAQNMDVFNLATQHPGAPVDTSATDYQAKANRFNDVEPAPTGSTTTMLPAHSTPTSAAKSR